MAIQFQCECGKSYKVDDKYAGRSITCKACGDPLTVPKQGRSSGGAKGAAPKRGPAPPPRLPGKIGAKKKKKQASPEDLQAPSADGPALSPKMIAILVVPVVFVLGGIAFGVYKMSTSSGGGGQQAAAPVQMAKYKSEHGGFSIDYPEDWSSDGGGGTGGKPPWAKFQSGDAFFQVRSSMSGSAIGDIAGAGAGMFGAEEAPEDLEPVAKVHEFQKDKMKVDYADYEETPAKQIDLPYGEGRISTFTGDEGLLGSNVKGYRVTLLATNFQFNIVAKCPIKQWDEYSATFEKMIKSMDR